MNIDNVKARAKRKRTPAPEVAVHQRLLHASDASEDLPQLRRQRVGRLVAGVAVGLADHLGVPVLWVRAAFAAMSAFFGVGIVAYGLLWVFVPQRSGGDRVVSAREQQQGVGLIVLGAGLALVGSWLGALPAWLTGPLAVMLVGAAVVWREADESQRRRWRHGARSGFLDIIFGGGGRTAAVRVAAGASLVVAGIVVFLAGNAWASGLRFALLAVIAALIGVAVLTIPWWVRLVRDLNTERASRIRSQERAEIAAHLHDSVLQTLALVQKQAESSRDVRRIARAQERELRTWLYGADGYGKSEQAGGAQTGTTERTLSRELARICGEVEDSFAIKVQHVVVGDCDLDTQLTAQLAAAREAIVNAAKHAGVGEVSVYAEVEVQQVSVYVRDRGDGFDPELVSGDRHGLSDSIRGRMERNGGTTRLRTAPGEGTEVQMEMPRGARQ